MALMGGLVDTSTDRIGDSHPSVTSEWLVRNAFALGLGACILFWMAVGAIFIAF